jgi:hypothetical protein
MIVEQIMNRATKFCAPEDSLNRAAQIMWEDRCGAVPVVDKQFRPIGFLTDRDICMAAYTQGKTLSAMRVDTAMAQKVFFCNASDDLETATHDRSGGERLRRCHCHQSPGRVARNKVGFGLHARTWWGCDSEHCFRSGACRASWSKRVLCLEAWRHRLDQSRGWGIRRPEHTCERCRSRRDGDPNGHRAISGEPGWPDRSSADASHGCPRRDCGGHPLARLGKSLLRYRDRACC